MRRSDYLEKAVFEGLRRRWRSRPSLVDQLLARAPLEPPLPVTPGFVRVGTIQMTYHQAADPAMWIEQCQALTQAARRAGAGVVIFPALAPLGLIGALGDSDLVAALVAPPGDQANAQRLATYACLYPACYRLYHRTFSFLAHRYGLTIATGGLPAPRQPVLTPVGDVFASDGRRRLHRAATRPGRLLGSAELEAYPVGEARITALAGDEGRRPEIATALRAAAVDLVAAMPLAGPGALDDSAAALAAASGLYVVRSCLVGTPAAWRGRSGVYAPPELTLTGTGLLAKTVSDDAEEVLVTTLDLAARRRSTSASTIGQPVDAAGGAWASASRVSPSGSVTPRSEH